MARISPLAGMEQTHPSVLVVEDDDDVRELVVMCLGEAGYRVLEAANGDIALPMIAGEEPIDLLFSDVVMSGEMNGFALARRAIAIRPNLKILLTSGYAEQIEANEALVARGELIAKPYRLETLIEHVARRLDADPVELNKVLFRLLEYWRSKCGGRPCPIVGAVELGQLADVARYLSILDVLGAPPDLLLRYRIVAPELAAVFGVDLAGRIVGEASPPAHRRFITGLYHEAVTRRLPVYSATGYSYPDKAKPAALGGLSTERLYLPLADEEGKVVEMLCGQTFDWTNQGATVSFVLDRTLGRKDTVERIL